jgi:demethylmenaquinone methyltransferase/2-methoxy-6-polyprenyl-1,4-benzoquinol methylase
MQDLGLSMKRDELDFVRLMFDGIAPYYDFLNRLLSFRQDVYWRRTLVSALHLDPGARVLDAACGTADVGLEIIRQCGHAVRVTGIDFAPRMLRLALPKIKAAASGNCIQLAAADAFRLPFGPGQFEAVTMAFGIRNIQDQTVLGTFHRQLQHTGTGHAHPIAHAASLPVLLSPPAAVDRPLVFKTPVRLHLPARVGGPLPSPA